MPTIHRLSVALSIILSLLTTQAVQVFRERYHESVAISCPSGWNCLHSQECHDLLCTPRNPEGMPYCRVRKVFFRNMFNRLLLFKCKPTGEEYIGNTVCCPTHSSVLHRPNSAAPNPINHVSQHENTSSTPPTENSSAEDRERLYFNINSDGSKEELIPIVLSHPNKTIHENATAAKPLFSHPNFGVLSGQQCGAKGKGMQGDSMAMPGELPWLALLSYRDIRTNKTRLRCGGSLISSRYVLTAAHCINYPGSSYYKLDKVRLGETYLDDADIGKGSTGKHRSNMNCKLNAQMCEEPYLEVEIEKAIRNPRFHVGNFGDTPFDIGLLRLKEEVKFTKFIQPICLRGVAPYDANQRTPRQDNMFLSVAGWGMMTMTMMPKKNLRKRDIDHVELNLCSKKLKFQLYDKCQVCGHGPSNDNICRGDSGGPLMAQALGLDNVSRPLQVGITSFGDKGCSVAVFTKVSCHLEWILDNITP